MATTCNIIVVDADPNSQAISKLRARIPTSIALIESDMSVFEPESGAKLL